MASTGAASPSAGLPFVPLPAESWRLLVEAEIDTIVRELRKNALWADAVEKDGLGALWVGGSRWPGTLSTVPETLSEAKEAEDGRGSHIERYRQEFASRRTLGKAGVCIGLASFADKDGEGEGDEYGMGRIMVLESFLLLREAINGVSDPQRMDLQTIIDPFLMVIRDPETTGPITRCALVSVQRFISHGIVDLSRIDAVPALLEMTQAVTHCRFEATDAASDEAVLMQILNVLSALVLSTGGSRLNDVTVCEIMETVLSMSCQMRLSEMLRKAAESTLFTLVTFVFGKLDELRHEPNASEGAPQAHDENAVDAAGPGTAGAATTEDGPPLAISTDSRVLTSSVGSEGRAAATKSNGQAAVPESSNGLAVKGSPSQRSAKLDSDAVSSFGLPAIRELYRVLVALTNPRDLQYTDTMRLLALNTLQAAFQKACYAMAEFATLRELTLGDLSHNLLLILQRDQPGLISPALRVLYLLFASHRRDTKGHLELFLCQTLGRVMTLPAVARQGSRSSLRLGGGRGASQAAPKTGTQKPPAKARVVSGRTNAGQVAGADVGLGISELGEKADGKGGSRRSSSATANVHDAAEGVLGSVPQIPRLLENESALSYEQEVELYDGASLRKGMRGRLATQETRRQLLEGLHHLLIGDESLITDLWVNYDCDMQRGNMFDFLISFIAHRAVPWADSPSDAESEAFLDVMLHHLIRVAMRAGVRPPSGPWARLLGLPQNLSFSEAVAGSGSGGAGYRSVSELDMARAAAPSAVPMTMVQLLDRKKHKMTMMCAAELFNEKPKNGIAYLQRMGMLTPDNSTEMAQQLAFFLRETPTINKRLLGEYLSKPSNQEVLQRFLQLFDFSGRRLDEALRTLLGTFRLPGESQLIERIVEAFAAVFVAGDPADIATKDAAFILSYAVIMLNTDQHSRQVKVRMKFEDFARNVRGVNDGQDFRTGFLTDVYNAIRTHEIVFPEEHEGEAGFEYAWHEVAAGDSLAGPWLSTRGHTAEYDRELLALTWPRFLQSLSRILAYFTSDHTLRLALTGLHALVASAAHYGLTACVNEAIHLLVGITGLASSPIQADLLRPQVLVKSYNRYIVLDPESPASAPGVVAEGFSGAEQLEKLQEEENSSVQLTQAALDFGKEYRGQIAFIALFELAAQFPSHISAQSWADILDVVRVAVDADLLPRKLRAIYDPAVETMWVPRVPTLLAMDAARRRVRARQLGTSSGSQDGQQGGGLLSAISSLWGSGGGGSSTGNSTPELQATAGRRRELRWRAPPELLVGLVNRSRMAVEASEIGAIGHLADKLGPSLPVFLTALAQLFSQPPPSPSGSPVEGSMRTSGDGQNLPQAAAKLPLGPAGAAGDVGLAASKTSSTHYQPSSVYFFEVAMTLIRDSPPRAPAVWSVIESAVQRMFEYADVIHYFSLQRAIGGMLNVSARIVEYCAELEDAAESAALMETVERILRCLGLLRDARDSTFAAVVPVLAEGLGRLVDADSRALVSVHANWTIIRLLLKRLAHVQDAADTQAGEHDSVRLSLAVLVEVVILLKCGAIGATAYFGDMLDTLAAFAPSDRGLAVQARGDGPASHMSGPETASKLITLLFDMQELAKVQKTPDSPPQSSSFAVAGRQMQDSHTEPSIASVVSGPLSSTRHSGKSTPLSMWMGAMNALSGYACAGNREVRQLACSHIQRAVSSGLDNVEWTAATFYRVLFPLMDTLQRADMLADSTMEDTHARCISMLTMVFLHNAARLQHAVEDISTNSGSPSMGSRPLYPDPASAEATDALGDGDSEQTDTPLGYIWLRLVRTLSVYIRTSMMASESRTEPQSRDVKARSQGVSLSESKEAAERRRHLNALGEMAEESVKNCMLVLDSMGIFGSSDRQERETNVFLRRSWEHLDRVNPRLRAYIFPQYEQEAKAEDGIAAPASPRAEEDVAAAASPQTEEDVAMPTSPPADQGAAADPDLVVPEAPVGSSDKHEPQSPPAPRKKHGRHEITIVP
ncbi:GDP/GTP exchange factor for ARF [Coemansia sp. RSA 552]|nr:GDP/GTP exchange factor for ARF [Coemansia sp. RSA 552]